MENKEGGITMSPRYLIRALKSVVSFFVLALLAIALVYFTTAEQERQVSFWGFLQAGNNLTWMSVFLIFFGFVYPSIGYVSQKIACPRALSEADKEAIIRIFAAARFLPEQDADSRLRFRHRHRLTRFLRLYEDTITVDYSEHNTLTVEGLRRDAYRLARTVEWQLLKADEEEQEEPAEHR
jgi:hypothetical protein